MKFSAENKEVKEFSDNYFDYGVHKVKIVSLNLGETDKDQEYVEVEVVGDKGQEDTVRLWFTSDAAVNYSFNALRSIFVHNAPEKAKDAARAAVDGVASTEELVELLGSKLAGKGECWYTKYQSKDRTYTAKDGTQKPSIEKNVYGYEPKLKVEGIPATGPVNLGALGVGEAVKDEPFPDSAPSIPSDDDWA